jgi:hypothetical protein
MPEILLTTAKFRKNKSNHMTVVRITLLKKNIEYVQGSEQQKIAGVAGIPYISYT